MIASLAGCEAMLEDVEEMERNGRACGKADNRSIELARIRVSPFSSDESKMPKTPKIELDEPSRKTNRRPLHKTRHKFA